jgi:hypothetical protein
MFVRVPEQRPVEIEYKTVHNLAPIQPINKNFQHENRDYSKCGFSKNAIGGNFISRTAAWPIFGHNAGTEPQ